MSGGNTTISTETPRVGALRYQQSAYGTVVPIVYGRTRISGNLIWYDDFTAIATTTTQESGGKGGSSVTQTNTTYTYEAAIMMALCEGPISGVASIWKGKSRFFDMNELALSLASGAEGQAMWGHLASHHIKALAYSGTAYVYASNYSLSDNAEVVNHTFEVSTPWEFGGGNYDALPSLFSVDALTNDRYGAMFPSSRIGNFGRWSDYCKAYGLMLSPAMTEQKEMREWLTSWANTTNSAFYWSEGLLKIEPYGDEAATGNGATFTPNLTPIYDLTDDDFLTDGAEDPVRVERRTTADVFNQVQVEFINRDNQYNIEVATASDQRHIEEFGLRPAPVAKLQEIANADVARRVAQLMLQRSLYIRNTYEFKLGWKYVLLEPMDLVTLTDAGLGLNREPVRIVSTEESESGDILVRAEDFPAGVASSALYPSEAADGFSHQYNADPGPVSTPVFLEPPTELCTTGLEVWAAVSGTTDLWGGCEVWVSYTGSNYKKVGVIRGGARYGSLTSPLSSVATTGLAVALDGNGGTILGGDAEDAAKLSTLCWVCGTGPTDRPEWLAYETATLTGANAYTLGGLKRGAYSSFNDAKLAGAKFVRVDAAVFKGEPLQPNMIGTNIRFKFVSFNVYGAGLQDISAVTEYSYTVRGDMALLPPPNVNSFTISIQGDGTRQFDWSWGGIAKPTDLLGYVVRYRQGTGPFAWEDMRPFSTDDGFHTASPIESNLLLAGPYVFAIKTKDTFGVLSQDALFIDATLPDPRLGNSLEYVDESVDGWLGTKTDCVIDTWDGAICLRARDQFAWDDATMPWDDFTRWVMDPVTSFVYEPVPQDFGTAVPVLPVAIYTADGSVVFEASSSDDGITWTPWAFVAAPITTRYLKTRLTVSIPAGFPTGVGVTPIAALRRLVISYTGKVTSETGNDQNTSTITGAQRIGVGDIRLPTAKTWARISRVSIALQNVGAGWTWTLIDKNGTDGPRIKIYNGSGALADALIDWTIEGIAA
jgi:Putative phage tail protein